MEISPASLLLAAPEPAAIGQTAIVYLDDLGRFAGPVVETAPWGFLMVFDRPASKLDKLVDQITWYANSHLFGDRSLRRHERVTPLRQRSILYLPPDQSHLVKILNVSATGVAIEMTVRPAIGASVIVGNTPATIVRHFDGGLAAKFLTPFKEGEVDETIRL
jgi:hypothetical protein